MAKSKPIGVRFDLDRLEILEKERGLKTAQQVVNFLMGCYFGDFENPIAMKKPVAEINQEPAVKLPAMVKSPGPGKTRDVIPPKPEKMTGEGTIAYLERVAIWKDQYGQS